MVTAGGEAALQAHLDHGDTMFGSNLEPGCEGGELTFSIDPALEPSVAAPPGTIGVVAGPTGGVDEFFVDEVQFRPDDPDELQAFLVRYGASVIQDDSVPLLRDDGSVELLPAAGDGWHRLRVNLAHSALADLPRLSHEADIAGGDFVFSSWNAARAVALQLRELDRSIRPNFLMFPDQVLEHPLVQNANDSADFVDFCEKWWMDHDRIGAPNQLSTSTTRAWAFLRNTGLPPVLTDEEWFPAEIAVVDVGFALDPESGLGSRDYHDCKRPPSRRVRCDSPQVPPLQLDLVEFDNRAGNGSFNGSWHGENMLGVCCAFPDNRFGAAGSGGEYVYPVPFSVMDSTFLGDLTGKIISQFAVAQAIRAAAFRGIPVISISLSRRCGWEWSAKSSLCKAGSNVGIVEDANLQQAVLTATSFGSVVIASAGNGLDKNFDGESRKPCKLDQVICVGGASRLGKNVFHWGEAVDIWGPTWDGSMPARNRPLMHSTVTPASAADPDNDDVGLDELAITTGTSAATAFVAGVAGILKSIDPGLRWDDVQRILQETANCSFEHPGPCPVNDRDSKIHFGWVDVLRAVQRVRDAGNAAPTVRIIDPADGALKRWTDASVSFTMRVEDHPNPDGFTGEVAIDSEPDRYRCGTEGSGLVLSCTNENPPVAVLPGVEPVSPLGVHEVTATAIDEFGGVGQGTIEVVVTNDPPSLTLESPADGSTHFSDQTVSFRVTVSDADGESYDDTCPAPGFFNACVSWTSSLDGPLEPGEGDSPQDFALALSEGTHIITAFAEDGQGATDSASISVEVVAGAGHPTARILSAPDSAPADEPITLTGEGSDPEDGQLSGAALQWFSDFDGALGSGEVIEVELSDWPDGSLRHHTITLRATDSDGNTDTDEVGMRVGTIQ